MGDRHIDMAHVVCEDEILNKVGTEFWAYQTSILKVAKNFKGVAWAACNCQYQMNSLA